ncbi:MAG: hypothetical protein ACI86C_001396 [Candidatus Latescibacterota bacterium]|jgi:hypothetical protein
MKSFLPLLLCSLLLSSSVFAQKNRVEELIISNYGKTFQVENIAIKTDVSAAYKVIFDDAQSSKDKNIINKYIY